MEHVPYAIPENWVWTSIENVSEKPQYGWTTKASDIGDLHLLRTTDITSGFIDWQSVPYCSENPKDIEKYLLHDDDIVISRAGSVGYSYLVKNPRNAVFASYLIRFKVHINPSYFHLFLQTPYYWHTISENKLGIAVPNVNATKLKKIQFPLAPYNEQVRIVSRVEELFSRLDAGVRSLQAARTQLEQYRQTTLKQAYTGKLTEKWRQKNPIKINNAIEEVNIETYRNLITWDIPNEWMWTSLRSLIEDMQNGIYKPKKFYSDDGIACLRMYNIENGKIIWKDIKRMILTEEEYKKFLLKPDDILINRVNSRELVGKSAVIPNNLEPSVYESKNIRMCIKKDIVFSNYIQYWMYFFSSRYFNSNAQQVVGMASINQTQISNMPIPMTTIKEQEKIVEIINNIDLYLVKISNLILKYLSISNHLKNSILKKAFEGRLVPQDPNDEPSSLLLKRIETRRVR